MCTVLRVCRRSDIFVLIRSGGTTRADGRVKANGSKRQRARVVLRDVNFRENSIRAKTAADKATCTDGAAHITYKYYITVVSTEANTTMVADNDRYNNNKPERDDNSLKTNGGKYRIITIKTPRTTTALY